MKSILTVILPVMLFSASALAQRSDPIERCESVPLPGHQVSMRVDGIEKVAWHSSRSYERPFFFPINGPSGSSLTRIGHPWRGKP